MTRRDPGNGRGWRPDPLPRILNITTRDATYDIPRIFFLSGERRAVHRSIEIMVRTDAPIPMRALSPVIWLGDSPVVEMDVAGPNLYRYYALEPAKLRDGTPIAFGWPDALPDRAGASLPERLATKFRLRLGAPHVA